MVSSPTVTLCGPQRLRPTIGEVAKARKISGKVGVITAGWREREHDDAELVAEVGLEAVNLHLYRRWRQIAAEDTEYFDLHRSRQDALRKLQALYRQRLRHLFAASRAVSELEKTDPEATPEVLHSLEMIADLDRHHLRRVKAVHVEFERTVRPGERPRIAREREEIAALLDGIDAVFIAGGHVAVLLNRLRLFALRPHLVTRHVVAWSAGAMAMTPHVLLFHDSPPWGYGDAEVLDHGLGLVSGVVALPHAYRRLTLDDRARVASMARRAHPSVCVVLPDGAHVTFAGEAIVDRSSDVAHLSLSGEVTEPSAS